jgi:hypothetical protein
LDGEYNHGLHVTSTISEPLHRLRLPGPALVWLALFILAMVLASTRPVVPDLRWHANAKTYFAEAEGLFYVWTIPAFGIVLSFASVLTRPIGRSIRRCMLRTWAVTIPGLFFVSVILNGPTGDFHQADVGSCGALLLFAVHVMLMVVATVVTTRILRRRVQGNDVTPARTVKVFAAVTSSIVVLMGGALFWASRENDPREAMRGEARAQAFLARLPGADRGSVTPTGRLGGGRWEGRNGSSIRAVGDQFEFQVPVPWPADGITGRATPEKIVEFLNSPTARRELGIAPEPWHAEWRGTAAGDGTVFFGFRTPADAWPFGTFFSAAGELDSLATSAWPDKRTAVRMLLDESYSPPADSPAATSRDAMQWRLLWLAILTERLATACDAQHVKISDGRDVSDVFRELAARASALRAAVRGNGSIPTTDLERLGNDAWMLAGEIRPEGSERCRSIDHSEYLRLNGLGNDIKTNAASVK